MFVEENEISKNSNGGTEITKRSIGKLISDELAEPFQIIPSRVRNLEEDKIRVYWQHDLPEDPEVSQLADKNYRDKFHKFVFSSNWQMQEFVTKLGMPLDDKMVVIETPIEPLQLSKKPIDVINLIYFSTPHRGLDLLVPVVDQITKENPNVRLDVFSSFKIYGWDDADKQFEPLYDQIRNHPNMSYHGFAPQTELNETLARAHILAYPNTWKETSCRVLIESMSAGLLCVHPNLAALPDTSGGLTSMYQYVEDRNLHANIFYENLKHAISVVQTDEAQHYTKFVKAYADTRFNLAKIADQWKVLMKELLLKYPTVESRALPKATFSYST